MDDNQPAYTPAEIVLVATAPYLGITLEKRILGSDTATLSEMELDMLPEASRAQNKPSDLYASGQISSDLHHYLTCGVAQVRRKCTIEHLGEKYRLEYTVATNATINPSDMAESIKESEGGSYAWGFNICSYDDTEPDKIGENIFRVGVDRNKNEQGKYVDKIFLYDLDEATLSTFSGLGSDLKNLMEEHPEGSEVDAVDFTIKFLSLFRAE